MGHQVIIFSESKYLSFHAIVGARSSWYDGVLVYSTPYSAIEMKERSKSNIIVAIMMPVMTLSTLYPEESVRHSFFLAFDT
jgi:hypothetical protein